MGRRLPGSLAVFETLSEQCYRFRQHAWSDAENTFNDASFATDVARQVENRSLSFARSEHDMNVELAGPWVQTDGRVKQRFQRAGVAEAFLPEQFRYDPSSDIYVCPEGKHLTARHSHSAHPGRKMIRYQANQNDCWSCPSRHQCCSSNKRYGRSIVVTQEDPVVSSFRERQTTPEARGLMRERARMAEFVNALLKETLGLRRFRVRGLQNARAEATWAILAYNVRQWIRLRWKPSLAV